ncbi:unnamed protein product, partial [marine sediment metagenome]
MNDKMEDKLKLIWIKGIAEFAKEAEKKLVTAAKKPS